MIIIYVIAFGLLLAALVAWLFGGRYQNDEGDDE